MKSKIAGIIFLSLAATIFAADTNELAIIPLPQKMEIRAGVFKLTAATKICADFGSARTAEQLAVTLRKSTGYPLKASLKLFPKMAARNAILLTTRNAGTNLGAEGYELAVAKNSVVIRARTQAGLFFWGQTFFQVCPPENFFINVVATFELYMPIG